MVSCNIPYLYIKRADGLAFFNLQTFIQKIPKADLKVFLSDDPNQKKHLLIELEMLLKILDF